MLSINWSDVANMMTQLRPYIIAIVVIVAARIIVSIAVRKQPVPRKYMIRSQSMIAMIVGIVVVLNMICTGPLNTILTLASGNGTLSQDSLDDAQSTNETISEEGIVLLKDEDNILPLANTSVNVFGWASAYPVYGGTGSGAMNDAYPITDLITGLNDAGIKTNTELTKFYQDFRDGRPEVGMWEQDWTLPEPTVDSYSDDLINNAKNFSDTAVVVIARSGGEHIDLPRDVSQVNYTNNSDDYEDFPEGTTYLEPSQTERNMIQMVCRNFDNVILVVNSANTMELGIANEYDQIKGVLLVPGTGQNGFDALGQILTGKVNPSGRTVDTFVADLTATPTYNSFNVFQYDNMDEFRISDSDPYMPGNLPHFVNYNEDIYVGYKFYETAAAEGLINYDDAVVYPFGYGLSYTSFSQEMGDITEENGTLSFDVTVTNTGDTAGKDVVEVYYNPPYTNGGIEKASANLIAFDKTDILEPGASQTISVSFNAEDMASYDDKNADAYVLEQGDYQISINNDSHNIIDSRTYTVNDTITYDDSNPRSTDQTAATNAFDFAAGNVTYLSRADGFANYDEATATPTDLSMPEDLKAGFTNNSWKPDDSDADMPTTGANNGLTLADLRGKDYDDSEWDQLLDQLTTDDMVNLVGLAGYQTAAAKSVGKLATTDCDGPSAINNNFTGVGSIGYACAVMIAQTWNQDLAYQFGDGIGQMADEMNVSGWYAPAMNIHRNAFTGRNFEYFSEDGLLSGKMASQAVSGAYSHGVYAYIKHFALNEMETNRWGMLCTWTDEQAMREIYLKPFEICVKSGDTHAVMSSYNYIGNQWAGACSSLLNTVLRDEWGYQGFVLTDYYANFGYMDATRSLYNGGDACLATMDTGSNLNMDTSNPEVVTQMRRAAHDIMYTVVNSRAYDEANMQTGLLMWQIILIVVDVAIAAVLVLLEIFVIRKGYKKRKNSVDNPVAK